MGQIEATKQLTATPEQIWGALSKPATWDQWYTIHGGWIEEPPADLSEGDKLVEKVVMLGMANKLEWQVEKVEAPRYISMSGKGMAGVKANFTFTIDPSDDGGANVTVTGEFEGALVTGALGKAVEKDGLKNLDTTLEQLADYASAN